MHYMNRDQIRDEIALIKPLDPLEAAHQVDALAWVDSDAELTRLLKPATPPKHLVSYFVVSNATNILLVDHKSAQLWLPTGGHVEPGEHPRETVSRELFEELGFQSPHEIGSPLMLTCTSTVGATSGHTDVSLWYLVQVELSQAMKFDESEFNAVHWFDFSEIPYERSDPHMRRFVEKLKSHHSVSMK